MVIFGALLEEIGLLFNQTSGHTEESPPDKMDDWKKFQRKKGEKHLFICFKTDENFCSQEPKS